MYPNKQVESIKTDVSSAQSAGGPSEMIQEATYRLDRRKSGRNFIMCPDREELQSRFASAVAELTILVNQQLLAIVSDPNSETFDELIAEANESRHRSLNALLQHIQAHGC